MPCASCCANQTDELSYEPLSGRDPQGMPRGSARWPHAPAPAIDYPTGTFFDRMIFSCGRMCEDPTVFQQSSIYVVVPAYNEAAVIERVVGGVRRAGYAVIVVDDGSSDDT